jgi:hypothetical protein
VDDVNKHGDYGENEGNSRRGDKCNDYLAPSEMEAREGNAPQGLQYLGLLEAGRTADVDSQCRS